MRIFFDTSAFVKRYIAESGTDAVLDWCQRATEIGLSAIAVPELISAFCRLRRENIITAEQYQQLKASLLVDIEDIAIGDLTPAVLSHTIKNLENNVLRAMDAIHIGSAIALECDTFVSADQRQLDAAEKAGLNVSAV
jgi:predicted nucleic acid-binding protein